jgi:two-component system response regulator FixJ
MSAEETIFVVDDDPAVRDSLSILLRAAGHDVALFDSAKAFLESGAWSGGGCLLTDIRMPDMDGLALQEELAQRGATIPVVVMTGHGDVPLAVRAMRGGAIDFLEKPFSRDVLLGAVRRALARSADLSEATTHIEAAKERLAELSAREREVFDLLVAGLQNKEIGRKLGISPRTVQVHRGRVMEKLDANSVQDLVRLSLAVKG